MSADRRQVLLSGAALLGAAVSPQLAAAQSAPAPMQPSLGALAARRKVSLDGPWRYILDPFDVAGRKPRSRRAFWENRLQTNDSGLIEYEWASSPVMHIPGAWNNAAPELTYYEGPVYFRRDITAPSAREGRHFLYFEAVNYAASVWLEGKKLGEHVGGFTPFWFDITDRIGEPGHVHGLVVRVDSRHGPLTIPGLDFDWKNYGGITRSVWWVTTPATHIAESFVRIEAGRLRADVSLDGPQAAGAAVELSIAALGVTARAVADNAGQARIDLPIPKAMRLWSPEAPQLYDVAIRAGSDEMIEPIGFRTLETRGRRIFLNGKPIYLRGIALHEEAIGPEGARALSDAQAQALLAEAKALGCNFVRLAHYPHADIMKRLADAMGLIVWAEIPVYWEEIAYEDQGVLALARTMLADMVRRDRNRASIAFWSIANETPQTPARLAFLERLAADARALDPTRLITAALNKNVDVGGVREGESVFDVRDPLGAALDVIAINQYEAWYSSRTPAELSQVSFRNSYDKPLMISEFGADALYGHRGPKEERWTEDYQAWLYEETLKVIAATPGCVGLSPWLLKDFRSPRRWHGRFQDYWNRKGLIAPDGRRKRAFETLRAHYAAIAAQEG